MSKLDEARNKINGVDKKMAELFEERMNAAAAVAEYKIENGLQVLDASREAYVIEKNREFIKDDKLKGYYTDFIENMMRISKNYQSRLINGRTVAYAGVPGAFAHEAAMHIFEKAVYKPYPNFKKAYEAVESGECDCAVLPIENSFAGDVAQVMDLAFFGDLYITGIYDLEIVHNLLGVKGAKKENIKTVVSHSQALSQCEKYLEENGFKTKECENTAVAAKLCADENDGTVAAIASKAAGKIYGLDVIETGINQSSTNTTRFAVFSKAPNSASELNCHFVMFFTVKNEAGALGEAIRTIGKYGYNLKALKSRPTKELIWDYYFYAEGIGSLLGDNGEKMLSELKKVCNEIKIAGSFEKEIKLTESEDGK